MDQYVSEVGTQTSVDVCVCTYRRAQVVDTLRSIAAQQNLENVELRVILADNDELPSAERAVRAAAAELGLDLTYLHAPAHNISVARNACLKAAQAEWIAFLDDDETAEPTWLSSLFAEARAGGFDAVLGRVQAVYRPEAQPWVRKGDFHSIPIKRPRPPLLSGYTCNVLVRRAAIGSLSFRPEFGRSGGEDLDFFYRFTDRGGRIGFTPEAVVRDPVPEERERFDWLARRWFRGGQSHAVRILETRRGAGARLSAALLAAAKASAYGLAALSVLPFGAQRRWFALQGLLQLGVISRLFGARVLELYGQGAAAAEPVTPLAPAEPAA